MPQGEQLEILNLNFPGLFCLSRPRELRHSPFLRVKADISHCPPSQPGVWPILPADSLHCKSPHLKFPAYLEAEAVTNASQVGNTAAPCSSRDYRWGQCKVQSHFMPRDGALQAPTPRGSHEDMATWMCSAEAWAHVPQQGQPPPPSLPTLQVTQWYRPKSPPVLSGTYCSTTG